MTPDIVREIIAETAIVTIFGIVGVIALGIGLRLADRGRAPTLLLAWAVVI